MQTQHFTVHCVVVLTQINQPSQIHIMKCLHSYNTELRVLPFVIGLLNLSLLVESTHWLSLQSSLAFVLVYWQAFSIIGINMHTPFTFTYITSYSSCDWIKSRATASDEWTSKRHFTHWSIAHLAMCMTLLFQCLCHCSFENLLKLFTLGYLSQLNKIVSC